MNKNSIDEFSYQQIPHSLNFLSFFCEGLKSVTNSFYAACQPIYYDTFATTNSFRKKKFLESMPNRQNKIMKNCKEARDVLSDPRTRNYLALGQR